jgi:hypothetical protein
MSGGKANGMAATVTIDRPVRRSAKPVTVSGSALAQHLDCSRALITKLAAEGVLHRDGSGFPLDQNRVAYLRHLRRERRQSPRSEADAEHAAAKAQWLKLRIAKESRQLMPVSEHNDFVDSLAGILLTKLGSLPARVAGADLGARRKAEAVVIEIRREIAKACIEKADQCGEPDDP